MKIFFLILTTFFLNSANAYMNVPKIPNPIDIVKSFDKSINIRPDFVREKRMINQIEDAIMDGDVEYLTLSDGSEVFSIYMETDIDKPKGGVIVLHSRGFHANWAEVVRPLRVGLAEKGWNTLSVQMPVLNKQAKYYDYVPIFPYAHGRIRAAVNFYKERGIDNVVLIAHGCGAHMSMNYIDIYTDNEISAYVGVGMGATDYKQKLIKPYPLEKMQKPMLDIFAQNDFPGVKRLAKVRKPRLNAKSKQMIIKNAGHYYAEDGASQDLIDSIGTWLDNL